MAGNTVDNPSEENVSDLRSELELYLFNNSNKINKPAIKFIMNNGMIWNAGCTKFTWRIIN